MTLPSLPHRLSFVLALLAAIAAGQASAQDDRHAGYYYPAVTSTEAYTARTVVDPEATRSVRLDFVNNYMAGQSQRPAQKDFIMFAKGADAEKLIITATRDGSLDTIYRMRAHLAFLTSQARVSPIFRNMGVEDLLTFFDLCKILGFTQLTITDGRSLTHQVSFE